MVRRHPSRIDGWPEAIELVILAVHAGSSPLAAVESTARLLAGPTGAAFAEVVHRAHRGMGLADALRALPESLGPSAAEFADSFAAAERYGSSLAPVLDRLAVEARAERRRRSEADARALPVRLSFPLVACTLPSFVLLAIVPAVLGAVASLRDSMP